MKPAQISPSVLNSFQDIWNDECPWMDGEKFKAQLLQSEFSSEQADAGNAVHDAAFDHTLLFTILRPGATPGLTFLESEDPRFGVWVPSTDGGPAKITAKITNGDGNTWLVDPALIEAIRQKVPEWGAGIAEVPTLITAEELGVPGLQISMRTDYLLPHRVYELKTSGKIRAKKYIESGQRLAYLVKYGIPLTFILAQVKITHPRNRPEGVRGLVSLDHCQAYPIDPYHTDIQRLQVLITSCFEYISRDPEMLAKIRSKSAPQQL